MGRRLAATAVMVVSLAWACGPGRTGTEGPETQEPGAGAPGGTGQVDPPPSDGGDSTPAPPPEDGGPPPAPDGGTGDAGAQVGPGPWPNEPKVDYTARYQLGRVQSVGVDEAYNIWLLDGDRIGVLRPGTDRPVWTRGVGQAAEGFGRDKRATGSTVICGGEGGRAYVGYATYELAEVPYTCVTTDWWRKHFAWIDGPGEPCYSEARYAEFKKGDLDAVRLRADGTVVLEEHLFRSVGASQPSSDPRNPASHIGIRNTNDWHYDEDRIVLTCQRVMRGPFKGDLYIGTNHGVTRIQGLVYNSHRHPAWYDDEVNQKGLHTSYSHGLGIAPNGDVLIATDEKIGILRPNENLRDFDRENTWSGPVPWIYNGYNAQIPNGLDGNDNWRGIAQTPDGRYYVGSKDYGLWRMDGPRRPDGTHGPYRADATFTELTGLPTRRIEALQATDDGSLFIGTADEGLWRLLPDGQTFERVPGIPGTSVRQLVYDPTVTPSMLYVLTGASLTVLRGP